MARYPAVACQRPEVYEDNVTAQLGRGRVTRSRATRSPRRARGVCTRVNSVGLAKRSQASANLFHEELWLLPGGKVPAFGGGVEMDEIVVGALGPTPRSLVDLFREDADGSRNGDVVVVEEGAFVFHIEASAGHARVRQPGEGDVVQDVVPGQVAVGLPIEEEFHDVPVAGHVVVDQPGGKGDG